MFVYLSNQILKSGARKFRIQGASKTGTLDFRQFVEIAEFLGQFHRVADTFFDTINGYCVAKLDQAFQRMFGNSFHNMFFAFFVRGTLLF